MFRRKSILVSAVALVVVGGGILYVQLQPKGYATPTFAADAFFGAVMRKDASAAVQASDDPCGMPVERRIKAFQDGLSAETLLQYTVLSDTEMKSDWNEVWVQVEFADGSGGKYPYMVRREIGGWRLQFERFDQDSSGNIIGKAGCESREASFADKLISKIRSLIP